MKRTISKDMQALQLFPEEKLSEFKHMSLRARLQWLEEANMLVKKVHGLKRSKAPAKPL
jgi:hypothetical protein